MEQSHDLDKIKRAIQKGDKLNEARKLMSARLETSWVAGQSDFDDLSLQAQLTLFTRDLTSSTALAKMTTSMVTDLDLSQVCRKNIKNILNYFELGGLWNILPMAPESTWRSRQDDDENIYQAKSQNNAKSDYNQQKAK